MPAGRHIDTRVAAGRPGFYNFRPLRKVGLDGGYFFLGGTTASLNAFARRNFTTVLAGILMASPVWGLRPMRALRFAFTALPSPGTTNCPLPFASLLEHLTSSASAAAPTFFANST